jgi:2-oxoisovalerate dehydrogenase E2 component (dihydrolipoyl transacylase)
MGEHIIKLPDVGEGVAEAELVEWTAAIGANVREDEVLAAVMTDKATVEIPSPVEGKVIWQAAKVGDILAVGSPLIRLEVDGPGNVKPGESGTTETTSSSPVHGGGVAEGDGGCVGTKANGQKPPQSATPTAPPPVGEQRTVPTPAPFGAPRTEGEKPLASPAVRKRAADAGIDLRRVHGMGPAGRISNADLDAYFESGGEPQARSGGGLARKTSVTDVPMVGLRRKIAEKMAIAKSRIAHITYVEEIDMTALEALRKQLNETRKEGRAKLTLLPFLMRAIVKAVADQPQINAIYDDEAGVVHQHGGVHIGVAAQTPGGLMVPVAHHVEARDLWDCAAEVVRLSEAARTGKATREELSGSTITITSLGAMGGIVTTPVINHPEVAIIGVNKMQVLAKWDGQEFRPRKCMNLSSSFDHRVIDGWDAAVFVQRLKELLETPAMIFID